jgi:hypothetical protein
MKRIASSLVLVSGLVMAIGCNKGPQQTAETKPPAQTAQPAPTPAAPADAPQTATTPEGEVTPEAAAPNDIPANVTLTDGSHYSGVLVSKSGTQLTFRGANGATRTFDSRDVKSMKFGDMAESDPATAKSLAPARKKPIAPAPAPADKSDSTVGNAPVAESAAAPAPAAKEIVIPTGTQISVRTNEAIDSGKAKIGDTFSGEISSAVMDDAGNVAIPRRSPATLVIRRAGAGKVKSNDLVLDVSSITVNGRSYDVETADYSQKGKEGVGGNKRTAKYVGGGAALGAIIGAIAGGGKGAAIGAAAGSGAGAGTQIFTRGSVKVPAESIVTFRLVSPIQLEGR